MLYEIREYILFYVSGFIDYIYIYMPNLNEHEMSHVTKYCDHNRSFSELVKIARTVFRSRRYYEGSLFGFKVGILRAFVQHLHPTLS